MAEFTGFTEKEPCTPLPDAFFHRLLKEIDDLGELKVTIYALWRLGRMEGRVHFLKEVDFQDALAEPRPALKKALGRGSLLEVCIEADEYYFLNSPRGRAAAEALKSGRLEGESLTASATPLERPNIYRLYEENIGPLTPLLADVLREAEQTYPAEWLAEALEIAVKNNKRSWKYVEAILKRWKEEGHAQEQDRRDAQETRGRDVTRKVDDFLKR